MSAGAPWSVKGIDPKTREIAKDLARRSGMTLGEWLNHMIGEGAEDDGVTPLGRQPADYRGPDRRARSRRLDDAYHDDEPEEGRDDLTSVARALDALSERIETAERRSTLAVSGIDQAVAGLLGKLETGEREQATLARRLDDFYEDRREDLDRLRRLEREVSGPKSVEALRALEGALGKVANQIYETETRTRQQLSEVQGGLAAAERRIEKAETRPDPSLLIDTVVAKVAERLERAERDTSNAVRSLETSFAQLDERMRGAETRAGAERLDKLAQEMGQKVADARIELIQRFDTVSGGRFDKVERTLEEITRHVQASETRSAQAIEKLGQEVLRIAGNLNGRMTGVEKSNEAVVQKVGGDMARFAEALETRLRNADAQNAQVLEKLGGEIARISEKLGERIIQSERRAALTAEDVGERVGRMADKMEARYDRASSELAERIRLSEERTVRLLDEARATLDRIAGGRTDAPEPIPGPIPAPTPAPEPVVRGPEPDPEPGFPGAMGGAFGSRSFETPSFQPPSFEPPPFGGTFDANEATPAHGQADAGFPTYEPAAPAYEADTPAFEPPYEAPPPPTFAQPFEDPGPAAAFDDFTADTEFVPSQDVRAGAVAAAASRPAVSTKEAIDAARAAARLGARNQAPAAEKSGGFALAGLKLGSKQRLQARLDKEKKRETSTVKKALLASAVAATVTTMAAGYIVFVAPGGGTNHTKDDGITIEQAEPLAAVALSPGDAALPGGAQADTAYQDALKLIESGSPDAVKALAAAANQGSPAAQYHLGQIYSRGESGVVRNDAEARRWFERSALAGHAPAMHNLAMLHMEGVGGAANPQLGVQWFRKAAEAGLVDSQYNLARLLEQGQGVARNPADAYKWYVIAAASGDEEAKTVAEALRASLTPAQRQQAERAAIRFQAAQAVAAQSTPSAPVAPPLAGQ